MTDKVANAKVAALLALTNMIKNKELDATNGMGLVMSVLDIINKCDMKMDEIMTIRVAKDFITEVAKGPDGVLGTGDDIISKKTLDEIDNLLKSSIVDDVLFLCFELVKRRRFDTKRALFCMSKTCFKSS